MKLIELVNSNSQVLTANQSLNLGIVDRKYACGCNNLFSYVANNTTLTINGSGYYEIKVIANLQGASANNVSLTLNGNGEELQTETITTDTSSYNQVILNKVIRVYNNTCCVGTNLPYYITITNGANPTTITNLNVIIEKVS